jgi:hypothetical protein
MIGFAHGIGVENIIVAFGIDENDIVLAVEGTPDGGWPMIDSDDFVQ